MSKRRRVFVVAWDGATLDLLAPWCDEGKLQTLKRIMTEGTHGELGSTYPPLTGPAWTSFMTGKSPGNHGVFEFFRRKEGSYSQSLNSQSSADGTTLWRLLSDAGKKVGVINVPLTYPPQAVNGFLISGLLTPRECDDWAYPQSLVEELKENVGRYLIHHDEKYTKSNVENLLAEQYQILSSRTEAALYLMKAKEWDFFMVHYYGPDRMTHEFWHFLDPSHPQHDPQEYKRFGNVVLTFFEKLDADLNRLISQLDEEDVLILMSDHGMGKVTKFLNVNSWLLSEGFVSLKSALFSRLRYALFRLGFNYSSLGELILRLGMGKQAIRLGRGKRQALQEKIFFSFRDVDWPRTKAYSMGNYGQIYVNVKGRDPQGRIDPGTEYEQVLDELTERLSALVDPDGNERIVEKVFRREDAYSGEHVEKAADLMFITRRMEYKALGLSDFNSPRILEPVFGCTGNHRMNGMLALRGKQVIRENVMIEGAAIQDLAPTILYMLGVPTPRDMDGVVLSDVFTPAFLEERQAAWSVPSERPSRSEARGYSPEEEEELAEILRGFGYA